MGPNDEFDPITIHFQVSDSQGPSEEIDREQPRYWGWYDPISAVTKLENFLFSLPFRLVRITDDQNVISPAERHLVFRMFGVDLRLIEICRSPGYFSLLSERARSYNTPSALRLFDIGSCLLQEIAIGEVIDEDLKSEEKSYLRSIYRYTLYATRPAEGSFPMFDKRSLLQDTVKFAYVSNQSPLKIALILMAPPAIAFAALAMAYWTEIWTEHSNIDSKNKKLALEAKGILMERLHKEGIEATPELIQTLMENSRIRPRDLPKIAKVDIETSS